MYKREVAVTNRSGLHARPASEFVKMASRFKSIISILFNGKEANAKSIISLLSAGICAGTVITVSADGPDEQEAVNALIQLVESGFGE